MEGKAILFKHFAGVDVFPICLATKDPDKYGKDYQVYILPSGNTVVPQLI